MKNVLQTKTASGGDMMGGMMKRHAFLTAAAALLVALSQVTPAWGRESVKSVGDLAAIEKQVAEVAAKTMPATVALVSEKTGSSGSGVITTAEGLILTAAHVVQGADDLLVVFPNGKQVNGRVLGANLSKDIGMVKIDEPGPWPFVERGESRKLQAGDWVVALGHSAGFDSARTPPVRFGRVVSKGPGNFFTTDATLIGGDSGGPIFDLHGKIIGVNSSIGMSLRSNNHAGVDGFREDWDRLLAGETWGELSMNPFANPETPVLGIVMGMEGRGKGVPVAEVTPRSPAAAAGVRIGDRLLSVDDVEIKDGRDLLIVLAKKSAGDKINLGLLRDASKLGIEVTLAKRETLFNKRSQSMGMQMMPDFENEDRDVLLMLPEESEIITKQYAELFSVAEAAAIGQSKATVYVYTGDKQVAYGTVIGDGKEILTKWSQVAKTRGALRVVDSQKKTHSATVKGVYEDEDLAVLTIDGDTLTPVRWSTNPAPELGRFIVATRADGKAGGFGVVSVLQRSLREKDQAFLGVEGDPEHTGAGVLIRSVTAGTGSEAAGMKKGDIILRAGDRAISGLRELRGSLIGKTPGDRVKMTYARDGKETEVEVLLGSRPSLPQFTNPRLRQMEQMGGAISKVRDAFPSVIQTDMQVKPEQCGGPVVDLNGNVIGVTVARADRTRSFLMPAAEVVEMLKRPTVDPAVARVGTPPADLPMQASRNQGPRPRVVPPDTGRVDRTRRFARDSERLLERLQEERDRLEGVR